MVEKEVVLMRLFSGEESSAMRPRPAAQCSKPVTCDVQNGHIFQSSILNERPDRGQEQDTDDSGNVSVPVSVSCVCMYLCRRLCLCVCLWVAPAPGQGVVSPLVVYNSLPQCLYDPPSRGRYLVPRALADLWIFPPVPLWHTPSPCAGRSATEMVT